MRNILLLLISLCLSCSTNDKKPTSTSAQQSCLDVIKDTKIKAPHNITYWGIFSNLDNLNINNDGYSLRVVKKGKKCQALIMDYLTASRPNVWAISNNFNCNLNQIVLKTSYAFYTPFENTLPFKRKFTFKGHIQRNGDLKGAIIFSPDNQWKKQSILITNLTRAKSLDHSMAAFDWETIQKMKLKTRCAKK